MPSIEEAVHFVEAMCGEHSSNIARLQEEREKLESQMREVERNLKDQHERLRVGNELMDILVKDRERREQVSVMTEVKPTTGTMTNEENRYIGGGKANY